MFESGMGFSKWLWGAQKALARFITGAIIMSKIYIKRVLDTKLEIVAYSIVGFNNISDVSTTFRALGLKNQAYG